MNLRPLALLAVAGVLTLLSSTAWSENILVLIADDLGVDRVGAYAAHPDPGNTPSIDTLAAEGVLFRKAWAHPSCSPTRAAMLTGLPAGTTGLGSALNPNVPDRSWGLDCNEFSTLPDRARELGYESAILGKWHLAGGPVVDPDHPWSCGFDYHAGHLSNIRPQTPAETYFDWTKTINGVSTPNHSVYATTDTVNDALAWITQAQEPWLAWVSFNAPHIPIHDPPETLHSYDLTDATTAEQGKAMIEAMDTEIGRLLSQVDPEVLAQTTVIFIGDNGTLPLITTPPFPANHAKFTVYEGGVNVPLIVSGDAVPALSKGLETDALVHAQDLFSTIIEIAGGIATGSDSISFLPHVLDPSEPSTRSDVVSEIFAPTGIDVARDFWDGAARDDRYKLIRRFTPGIPDEFEFYDLQIDPFEASNLLDGILGPQEQMALRDLELVLEQAYIVSVPEPSSAISGFVALVAVALLRRGGRSHAVSCRSSKAQQSGGLAYDPSRFAP